MAKLFPKSLRSRLLFSFGLLVFLSLFLGGIMTVYQLREQQEKAAREKVGLLAEPVALRTTMLEAEGNTAAQIQATLEKEYDVRILIIDRDATVVGDTGQTLRGQTISELREQGLPAQPLPDLRYRVQRLRTGAEKLLLFTSQKGVLATAPGAGLLVPRYQAVVAVPESDVREAWRELIPRLLIAGGIALAVSVVAAGLLARSITRPLQQITAASEEMARGRYEQQIPSYGGEEVGRLAHAFNAMARQVNSSHRTLREFLANVSHELKTPLTSIQGFSQAIVDGSVKAPEDLASAGRIINDEAVRMRELVDDLLYLSRAEAGENVLSRESVNVPELVRATRRRFERRAEQAEVRLVAEARGDAAVSADPRRLEQALANLVDNALRHTPAGGEVTLRSAVTNGTARLAVHNTGSVIPPEALPRIFDRFFQVDPAKTKVDGHTGLGLAITKEIIEAHGGLIEAHSSEGEGTEFVITMAVAAGNGEEERPA